MINSNSYEKQLRIFEKEVKKVEIESIKLKYSCKKFKRKAFKVGNNLYDITEETSTHFHTFMPILISLATYSKFEKISKIISFGIVSLIIAVGIIITTISMSKPKKLPILKSKDILFNIKK